MKSLLFLLLAITAQAGELQLTLPPVVYAVPEFRSASITTTWCSQRPRSGIALSSHARLAPERENRRLTVTAADQEAGDHSLSVTVKDAAGKDLERGQTSWCEFLATGRGQDLAPVIVGGSLTHATRIIL